MFKDYEYKH